MINLLSPSRRRKSIHFSQAAFAACLLMTSAIFPVSSVRAEDTTDSRLRQLEGSVDTLNRAVFKGEKPDTMPTALSPANSDYQASVESRLSALETQIRDLTGKVEQQEFNNTQLKATLDKALADINLRFEDAGKSGATPTTNQPNTNTQSGTLSPDDMGGEISDAPNNPTPTPTKTSSGNTTPPTDPNAPASESSPTVKTLGSMTTAPGGAVIPPKAGDDPAGQYEAAFAQLKSGNFASAKSGFENFIQKNPTHPLISNATYWLGESYYANGEFDKAARIFAESYKKYPKGPKVADSLLKMGMSLGSAGKKKEGCVALSQLKKEFPTGQSVVLRRADQEMSRLGCS